MAHPSSNAFASNRNGLIGHHLRSDAQSVVLRRVDYHPKIRRNVALGSHLADHDRRMLSRQGIRLNNHCGTRLTIVSSCCNCHYVAASHRASNSETNSVHRKASNSRDGSSPATCLATRLRTAFERASGTTKRSSRKPRARRRSRIILIRSAARAIGIPQIVTRYSVTRYPVLFKLSSARTGACHVAAAVGGIYGGTPNCDVKRPPQK